VKKFVPAILVFFFVLCSAFGLENYIVALLSQVGIRLGGRVLSFFLLKILGNSGILTLAIVFAVNALITAEVATAMNMDAGGSGASTSFPKPEWERALSLPDNQEAPACLRSHVEEELIILFNIGRKRTLSEQIHRAISAG